MRRRAPHPDDPHRVVIIGGGFGGLAAARTLRRAPVAVTLVDRANHHLFQPLLYQVASGTLTEGEIAPPLRGVLRRQANAAVVLADVRGFDLERRAVRATGPGGEDLTLDYDTLIVAAGAGHAYAGHDAWAEHAPALKTLADARRIRSRVLGAFERAELAARPGRARRVAALRRRRRRRDRRRARGADRRARAPDPAARLRGHRHPDRADRAARGRARPAARLPGGAAAPRRPRPRAAGRRRAHGRRGVRRGRGRRRGAVR